MKRGPDLTRKQKRDYAKALLAQAKLKKHRGAVRLHMINDAADLVKTQIDDPKSKDIYNQAVTMYVFARENQEGINDETIL